MTYAVAAGPTAPPFVAVPNRRDHSVNGAWVDGWNSTMPVFRTQTNRNPPGGYTGGGVGNKAILGHFLGAPMPLGTLATVTYRVTRLNPEAVAPNLVPYANVMVQLSAGLVCVLVFGDVASALLLGTYTTPGPNQTDVAWSAASDGVLVVNDVGMCVFPNPPGPVIVGVSQGPIQGPTAASWQTHAYTIASILAVYPGAVVLDVNPLDGGLPAATIMSGLSLNAGSSASFVQAATSLDAWTLNGSPI